MGKLIIVLALLISGCAAHEEIAATSIHPSNLVNVTWDEDPMLDSRQVAGHSSFANNICKITTKKPRDSGDRRRFEVLGHELLHCTDGQWHLRAGK
jgi:hypothetical protein